MRELAGWQPPRYPAVARWPLREALLAFEQRLKREARDDYRHELLRFAMREPWLGKGDRKPPKPPDILR